jgi:hypothetical protein
VEKHQERLKNFEHHYIKPGEFLRLPININTFKCKLEDGKINIPNWYLPVNIVCCSRTTET